MEMSLLISQNLPLQLWVQLIWPLIAINHVGWPLRFVTLGQNIQKWPLLAPLVLCVFYELSWEEKPIKEGATGWMHSPGEEQEEPQKDLFLWAVSNSCGSVSVFQDMLKICAWERGFFPRSLLHFFFSDVTKIQTVVIKTCYLIQNTSFRNKCFGSILQIQHWQKHREEISIYGLSILLDTFLLGQPAWFRHGVIIPDHLPFL